MIFFILRKLLGDILFGLFTLLFEFGSLAFLYKRKGEKSLGKKTSFRFYPTTVFAGPIPNKIPPALLQLSVRTSLEESRAHR